MIETIAMLVGYVAVTYSVLSLLVTSWVWSQMSEFEKTFSEVDLTKPIGSLVVGGILLTAYYTQGA